MAAFNAPKPDPYDPCSPQRVAMQATEKQISVGKSVLAGVVMGAIGGGILGAIIDKNNPGTGAMLGAAAGGLIGAAASYGLSKAAQNKLNEAVAHLNPDGAVKGLTEAQQRFDTLTECRLNQARSLKGRVAEGSLARAEAEKQMNGVRVRFQDDVRIAAGLEEKTNDKLRAYVTELKAAKEMDTSTNAAVTPAVQILEPNVNALPPAGSLASAPMVAAAGGGETSLSASSAPAAPEYTAVTKTNVYVRQSDMSSIVDKLKRGDKVSMKEPPADQAGWSHIQKKGRPAHGYVRTVNIELNQTGSDGKPVPLRSEPTPSFSTFESNVPATKQLVDGLTGPAIIVHKNKVNFHNNVAAKAASAARQLSLH